MIECLISEFAELGAEHGAGDVLDGVRHEFEFGLTDAAEVDVDSAFEVDVETVLFPEFGSAVFPLQHFLPD